MKLASIVVPVYNIEKYIKNCIESLCVQTYQNLEIILVDDGTLDNSGKICDEYAKRDSRIRVIHKENGGLSDARNKGAQAASGEYLFFVDGDDCVAPDLVEKTVLCAEIQNADMVIFDFESVEEDTGRRDLYHFDLPESTNIKTTPELILKTPAAWCRMYKKEFWDCSGIRYPEKIQYEDLATTPRLILKAKKIAYVGDKPLYFYMLREGSIMRSNNFERSYQDRKYVLSYLKKYFQEQGEEQHYEKEMEYLFFEHGYFVPSKEIILADTGSMWLKEFRSFALKNYPEMFKNPYIKQMSGKDKILLFLMRRKWYRIMNLLSGARKQKDSWKKE